VPLGAVASEAYSDATLTTILPVFSPCSTSMKARGVFSKPSRTVSVNYAPPWHRAPIHQQPTQPTKLISQCCLPARHAAYLDLARTNPLGHVAKELGCLALPLRHDESLLLDAPGDERPLVSRAHRRRRGVVGADGATARDTTESVEE